MYNWKPLAHKEYSQAVRWRGLWILTGLALLLVYYGWGVSRGIAAPRSRLVSDIGSNVTLASFQFPIGNVIGLAALLISYQSLTSASGTHRLSLIAVQPHSRRDIFIGTIVGRTAAVWTFLGGLFLIGGALGILTHGVFDGITFIAVVLGSLFYVLTVVSLGTSISAIVRSRALAAPVAIIYYLLFTLLWESVVSGIVFRALAGPYILSPPPQSQFLFLLKRAVPVDAYDVLVNAALNLDNAASIPDVVLLNDYGDPFAVLAVGDAFNTTPLVLHPLSSVLVLSAWLVLPVLIGYIRFNTCDLA
ncbi:ABC transporter permease subunit [Haladaptatus sp. DYF46]|uniref:ABC transporter permease n=1 Tax=Haladaptatus sp. DYF46 TaxID=2886041 RepID=UPI001E506E6C|nr:ABC transporter permease subunit [Haladaptatus sp. DYF46]